MAGCNGSNSGGGRGTSTGGGRRQRFDPDSVLPHRRLRAASDDLLLWDSTVASDGDSTRRRRPTFIASRETADQIEFADLDGAADARAFLAETAFDAETIYVERYPVRACYTLQLCGVSWTETSIDTEFGRILRDADVACEADARESTAWLIRIPEVLDPDRITNYGSGSSSRSCSERGPPNRENPITADAVPATNATANTAEDGDV
ncbi:hypothetical protein [Halobaculum limi]|uniref:hypothetical protein n=1 Tax=Halobaculum limi TaxID=3031916 RepID=UPI00240631B8|nr:hypothetical protein [Halobaculum sp. YSMS11]